MLTVASRFRLSETAVAWSSTAPTHGVVAVLSLLMDAPARPESSKTPEEHFLAERFHLRNSVTQLKQSPDSTPGTGFCRAGAARGRTFAADWRATIGRRKTHAARHRPANGHPWEYYPCGLRALPLFWRTSRDSGGRIDTLCFQSLKTVSRAENTGRRCAPDQRRMRLHSGIMPGGTRVCDCRVRAGIISLHGSSANN